MSNYNIAQAARALVINAKHRKPTMLLGAPGIGKSDIVNSVALELGWSLIDIRVSQKDAVDTRGLPVADLENGTTRWLVPSDLPNEQRDGAQGILFLDELTNAPMSVQAALYQLVLDRRLGDYVLPYGWIVFAAGNRTSDKSAAQRLSKALADRFTIINVDVDVDAWLSWAASKSLAPELRAFIAMRRQLLSTIDAGQEQFATPRSVARLSDYLTDSTLSLAELRMMITCNVGDDWAGEFMPFLSMFRTLPAIADIIRDPANAVVPSASEPSLLYAIACALADSATRANFPAIMVYANRMPVEYRELLVSDATSRVVELKETPAYINNAIARAS